ncbi:MAG: DUF3261 domain-containing protein [Succinivibrio sp.]
MIRILLFISALFLISCTTTDVDTDAVAYLSRDTRINIPSPVFTHEFEGDLLLTANYGDSKKSILITEKITKDSLTLQGMTPSYISLFKAQYDSLGLRIEYLVPKAVLPSVNQALLDIMLSNSSAEEITRVLKDGYFLTETKGIRLIKNSSDKIIYKIEYDEISGLVKSITNNEFNYSISIKYL